ncbi:long-chain-fatty-acid--CoA ligase [Micromonospora mirobrigensis]|uniref:Fatty-acyl-CoA synthase n=1 Tax=Micromonospora mirobrigensis TaxID=262898 RepID=A0A1C5A057_9ACTN|nr:long-chain-fatty-acid--CoA ligase [Micromonospora mirobrigensis]SCF38404.1 fatty-acyl-CoA synthase [Micromonospora mirobrigensis]
MTRTTIDTLTAASAANAAAHPDDTAVICEDRSLTFGQLHAASNRTAHALLTAGLRRGARVAFLGKESEHYYDLALGCAKAGLVLVPINWRLTAVEVDHIVRDSGAELLFAEGEYLPVVERIRGELPGLRGVVQVDSATDRGAGLAAWKAGASAADLDPGTGRDDPVVQLYTSGTTGLPKGAMLAHRSFFAFPEAAGEGIRDWIDWRPGDVSLIALPGFHIAGFAWFMHGFVAGVPNVVMRAFVAQDAVRLIARHRVSVTYMAPAMLQMLLAEPEVTRETFRSLRKVTYGAAPISESLLEQCLEMMDCDFAQIYASTETGSVAVCLRPVDHVKGSPRMRSAGLACPGVEIKIVDGDGHVLPPREIGQVCLRTGARMLGYWNLPEATAKTLVGEWLHMGDAGYLDEDGYLFLCDRINDTIIVAAQNIYPAEVERAIGDHPAVADVAVVGVPHENWGEAVHACVLLREGHQVTPRQLMLFLKGRIADFKIPVGYTVVDDLPRNPSGKILRRTVRERLLAVPAAA